MNFHRKSNVRKKIVIFFLVVILGVGAVYSGLLKPVVYVASAPFLYVGNLTKSVGDKFVTMFASEQRLIEENKILNERINKLEFTLASGEGVDVLAEGEYVPARVLVRPSQNIYGTLLVKKERDESIKVGDQVLSVGGVFIGIVDEVMFSRIRVKITSHSGFSQNFSIKRSGIPITIVGTGGGNMRAELPQGSDIEEFDVVVDLESGRVVAEVGEIVSDEASAFMKVYLRMPVNIFEITKVLIVQT